ncbi:MAG: peptidoglycan bridge formation glycyltransferase FemA/FemB family protein [bacterium]|nr:peptidoglycan bridge formation glycyltransferase FemA/FemB family protein [bacterium]
MNFSIKELMVEERFEPLDLYVDAAFTQAEFYGAWQKSLGRTVRRFLISEHNEPIAYFQLVTYPLFFGKNYLYAPYGPVSKVPLSKELLSFLREQILKIAQSENAVFVRLDFTPAPYDPLLLKEFFTKSPRATYRSANFQPRAEWFLGLDKTENELLMAMHEKTRYSIRLAERKGVTSEIIGADFGKYFDSFYDLMCETAKRDGFHLHEKEYYKNIFQSVNSQNAFLSVAKYQDRILAVNLIIVYGKTAHYVFGGLANAERNLMSAYAAQWAAICHAKTLGCAHYNFGGVAVGKTYKGWGGLTAFKQKFGGMQIVHADFYDVVANRFWYLVYCFIKTIKNL